MNPLPDQNPESTLNTEDNGGAEYPISDEYQASSTSNLLLDTSAYFSSSPFDDVFPRVTKGTSLASTVSGIGLQAL
jgi:hypothetical protein